MHGYLREARCEEIIEAITDLDQTFSCHKTIGGRAQDEKHCAGATILLQKIGMPNQMMRISGRLRLYDPDALDMDAPVFDSPDEFISHHAEAE